MEGSERDEKVVLVLDAFVLFTDLDGTLLDHHTYSYAPARPALERLRAAGIPLILNSSKTRAEMAALREEFGNQDPFIVENGSVLCGLYNEAQKEHAPDQFFGPHRSELLKVLRALRNDHGFQFESFADWSDEEIARATGLPLAQAALSSQRQSSEPLLWRDEPNRLAEFEALLETADLALTRGGRFFHVLGKNADKGRALLHTLDVLKKNFPDRRFLSVALGDSPNDRSMLEAADIPVVIEAANGQRLVLTKPALFPRAPGPEGWNEAVHRILDDRYRSLLRTTPHTHQG